MQRMTGWSNLPFRYAIISLIAATLPLLLVGGAYDRYATGLLEVLTGERVDQRLAAVSSRISGFLDTRFNQLNTLVHYPGLGYTIRRAADGGPLSDDVRGVLEYEADHPDLYGILLFDDQDRFILAFPSQSASGPPYWGGGGLQLDGAPRVNAGNSEIIGPIGPSSEQPGSLIIRQPIGGQQATDAPLGWIGLHVRLASVTELLGTGDADHLVQALLLAPDGKAYAAVGIAETPPGDLVPGPAVLPGWQPALSVEIDRLAGSLWQARYVLVMTMILLAVGLVSLFFVLWLRLSGRLAQLVDGAQKLASGQLDTRLRVMGRDEISALAAVFNSMAERLQSVIQARLEAEKMAALGRFSTSIAHEIRNPLATLKTSVEALMPGETEPERHEILLGIDDEIDRLDDTLQDILSYARPREPRPGRITARQILHRFEVLASPALRERGIRLMCAGDTHVALVADPGHVQQILTNLVLNAADAMPEGGTLTVRSSRRAGWTLIEVSDTGIGMSAETVARAVEPFFTTRPNGTGLGLAISRQLVELNGGQLGIDSRPGFGTTVMIRFPMATEPVA